MLELAETLIAKKSSAFSADKYHDHYVEALKELVARKLKLKGGKVTPEEDEAPRKGGSNVIDLMAALKKSIERPAAGAPAAKAKTPAKKPARKKAA